MRRIRVLHIIPQMGTGGAESLIIELVRNDEAAGWESAVASGGGLRLDELRRAGITLFDVPTPRRSGRGMVTAVRATRRALRAFRPDIVVAHNVKASVVTRLATCVGAFRPPVLTIFHGTPERDYARSVQLLRRCSDQVVAVSADTAKRLTAAGLRKPEPVCVRNAVRARNYPDRYAARRRLDVPAEARVVLCLARLVEQKRHDLLLKAWQEVAVDAVLLIAGDGPLHDDLQRQAEKLDIAPSVRFLGARSDVDSLLSAADITVLTSDWEGLPLAVLESMAAGRPVVATDVGGIREVLAGGGGVVVPPREPATTARVLTELLSDSTARERAAEAGRRTIENCYHPATMVSRYDSLFRGLISAGQPVRAGSAPRSP